ncbi:MAG: trigger factor [Planctomycetota bacterium]|jgi:trigger factor
MSSVETEPNTKLDLKLQINQPGACQRHVVVTIPRAELDRYFRKAYDEIAPRADLPGFRAGKIPRKLLESRFKKTVADQVKSNLVMDSLQQITEGGEFSAISEPDMDYGAVNLPEAGDFTFEFNIEVRPEFSTPAWEGLELTKTEYTLTEDEVERQLVRTLERVTPGEAWDGEARMGDRLVINAEFAVDGKRISGLDEELITLRPKLSFADSTVDNFGDLFVGAKEGTTGETSFNILDTSLNESLRNAVVHATFDIVEIRRVNVEGLSTTQLAELGFDSTEELRDFVRAELHRQAEYHQNQLLREQIVEKLIAGANWELPPGLVRRQADRELQRRVLELRRSGFNDDQIRSVVNSMRRNIEDLTKGALREHFVLEKIGEALSIEPSEEEYDAEIKLIAEQGDSSPRQVRAKLERTGQMDAVRNQILERIVIRRITEAAKVTTAPGDSILKSDPEEFAVEFLVAPVSQSLPEAKYDEAPEDKASDKGTIKPTQS